MTAFCRPALALVLLAKRVARVGMVPVRAKRDDATVVVTGGHGLRKRRGSLLSKQGYSLAEIAERLGDTKVVTAEHYMYAIGDYAEADYGATLERRE